jgi:radical SAM protein with 4Fe4S-binding SPASM domain
MVIWEISADSGFIHMTPLPTLVDQVYRTVLCRPADTDGLSYCIHRLNSGEIDLASLIDVLYNCPEYLMVVGPAIEQVRTSYRLLFEREPTQPEIYKHVQAFRGTCSSDDEAISLLRTDGAALARFAIRPLKIEMDITNQCNIRCIMCPFSDPAIGSRKRRDLSKETFLRWADEMFSWATQLGLLFGTEPTLNPNLVSFVRTAKEYRVPNVYFSTNAMKLTPALAVALIEAGLDELNVSFDAGTKLTFERIRRGAKWDTVVGNLKSLRDQKAARKLSRPRLHLSFVMMRSNVQELPQFVELAAELGAVVVYFTHLVPYDSLGTITESLGTNLDNFAQYFVDRALLLARQCGIQVVLPRTRQVGINVTPPRTSTHEQQPNHLADLDQAREAHGLPKRVAADEANSCCPFPWHFIAIQPDGSVVPCGWWHSGPPMGNLYTQNFQEIWSGEPMRSLRSQLVSGRLGANCSRCPAAGVGSSDSPESFQSR